MIFNGARMPTEYATVDSATDNIISYLCTQKNIKIEVINGTSKKQLEECYGVWVAYYEHSRESAIADEHTLAQVQRPAWYDQIHMHPVRWFSTYLPSPAA